MKDEIERAVDHLLGEQEGEGPFRIELGHDVGPGKFESSGEIGKWLYDKVMDSWQEDELGDAQGGFGWYGLLMFPEGVEVLENGEVVETFYGAIVYEDGQGSFGCDTYITEEEARKAWNDILAQYEEWEYTDDVPGEEG